MGFHYTLASLWNLPGYQFIRLFLIAFYGHIKPYNFDNNLPVHTTYDFIVVGSGAAGSTVAARLAETAATVLLLEEGPSATRESMIPYAFPLLGQSQIISKFRVKPQDNAQLGFPNNSGVIIRGVTMGGGTTINGCQFVKGSREDFDHWASLGNTGWDYDSFLPYYQKSENYVGDVFLGEENLHGKGGPITFRSRKFNGEFMRIVGRGAGALGHEVIDPSSPRKIGFATILTNVDKGLKVSTSEAYLKPIVRRNNLLIKPRASVRKILFDGSKRAVGVEFVMGGKLLRVRARKEVIVSAGAINSPKLLMVSGVGPADHLREMGVEVIANVEGVGQNYQDHHGIGNFNYEYRNYKETSNNLIEILKGLPSYGTAPTGPLTEYGPEAQAFINIYDQENKLWPDVGLNFIALPFIKRLSIFIYLTRPKSKGVLRLRSKNHQDDPIVDPRFFSHQDDMKTMISAMRFAHLFASSKPIQEELGLKFSAEVPTRCQAERRGSDPFWECLARHWVDSSFHYAGTCKMGPERDPMAVVSPSLKVKGVEAVRVVDASIMPQIVTTNIMSTVIAIAEKAADMIREEYSL